MRIDKWLWAARFFKTRSLATEAVPGGRVHMDGARVKPAKDVRVGDRLEITIGEAVFAVEVRGLADKRGPASQAQRLYEETEESRGAARAPAGAAPRWRRRSAPTCTGAPASATGGASRPSGGRVHAAGAPGSTGV